jgi:beta-lactam-binding protein with PASTA domain
VRGIQVEDAATFLEQNMLRYTVIDSIYSKEVMPGAIVELMPEANAKVKKNRTIYITINAKTEETVSLPDVTDASYRHAYAQLRSLGFDVERKYVPGDFLDLTVGVEYKGNLVSGGMRVPRSANLILLVSDGNIVMPDDVPAIDENIEGDESWF